MLKLETALGMFLLFCFFFPPPFLTRPSDINIQGQFQIGAETRWVQIREEKHPAHWPILGAGL